jgi:hypothetical protein
MIFTEQGQNEFRRTIQVPNYSHPRCGGDLSRSPPLLNSEHCVCTGLMFAVKLWKGQICVLGLQIYGA